MEVHPPESNITKSIIAVKPFIDLFLREALRDTGYLWRLSVNVVWIRALLVDVSVAYNLINTI